MKVDPARYQPDARFWRAKQWTAIEHHTAGEAIVGTMTAHVLDMIARTQSLKLTADPNGVGLQSRECRPSACPLTGSATSRLGAP